MSLLTPSLPSLRARCPVCTLHAQQLRHATLLRRPKRPYTFTQLITLSDGSTFVHRTTSPQPIYRSTKDTKNSALWNPSSQKLLNIEEDEAGRLKRFRKRFGRGFDIDAEDEADAELQESEESSAEMEEQQQYQRTDEQQQYQRTDESLLDLISGAGKEGEKRDGAATGKREEKMRSGKGKGGEK